MTRSKVRLAWIENETSRKVSFKKRREGLLKKMKELTTLCGVSAFIIINCPGESGPPAIWPSMEEARELYQRFRSVPDVERCKKMVSQESYLRESSAKMAEQIRRHQRLNMENTASFIMAQIFGQGKPVIEFEPSYVSSAFSVMNDKLKNLATRIQYYDQTVGNQPPGSSSNLPPPIIPAEDIVMPPDHRVPWGTFLSGILNNIRTPIDINVAKANHNNNSNDNISLMNNVVREVVQGPSVGMQAPDRPHYFAGATSHASATSFNVAYPNYYGAGSSSGFAGTGNIHGFQLHPFSMNGQNLFGHGIENPIVVNGGDANNVGFAPYRPQVNLGGAGTTALLNLRSGGVDNSENVGFGVQSGQGDIIMAENGSFATNVTRNDIIAAGKRPWFGPDNSDSAGIDSFLFDFNKNWPGPSN